MLWVLCGLFSCCIFTYYSVYIGCGFLVVLFLLIFKVFLFLQLLICFPLRRPWFCQAAVINKKLSFLPSWLDINTMRNPEADNPENDIFGDFVGTVQGVTYLLPKNCWGKPAVVNPKTTDLQWPDRGGWVQAMDGFVKERMSNIHEMCKWFD